MQASEFNDVLCLIGSDPKRPGYCVPAALSERIHLDGDTHGLEDARVLVVGDGTFAADVALELFRENEVCLLTRSEDLQHLEFKQRTLLLELSAEAEITLLRTASVEHMAATALGQCEVFYLSAGEHSAQFDHIFYCGEKVLQTTLRPNSVSHRCAG